MKFFPVLLFSILFLSCGTQEIIGIPPATYVLKQNVPNPFTDTTSIEYGVPSLGTGVQGPWIRLVVYDRFQQKQATLVNTYNHPAKTERIMWDGRGVNGTIVPKGIYFIELQQLDAAPNEKEDNLIVLLRITALRK
ncbi:MAG: hypothetical protein PHP42_14275 [Bacteroidota bacterium]|nr:hypothetical protein [Bacteroidota bacterium]